MAVNVIHLIKKIITTETINAVLEFWSLTKETKFTVIVSSEKPILYLFWTQKCIFKTVIPT